MWDGETERRAQREERGTKRGDRRERSYAGEAEEESSDRAWRREGEGDGDGDGVG